MYASKYFSSKLAMGTRIRIIPIRITKKGTATHPI
jgi:hypothetical protein